MIRYASRGLARVGVGASNQTFRDKKKRLTCLPYVEPQQRLVMQYKLCATAKYILRLHCQKIIRILGQKLSLSWTERVQWYTVLYTMSVHACFFVVTYIWPINQMYSVASAPTVIGSVFKWKFILFLGQCARIG